MLMCFKCMHYSQVGHSFLTLTPECTQYSKWLFVFTLYVTYLSLIPIKTLRLVTLFISLSVTNYQVSVSAKANWQTAA